MPNPKPVVNEFQPAMTEWFATIGDAETSAKFRDEDNRKNDRLESLYQAIGLAYERPTPLEASIVASRAPEFLEILENRGDELCAFRLVPKKAELPKLRNRGLPIREVYETWFKNLDINHDDYTLYIYPHSDSLLWSGIFMIKGDIIFGEIVPGLHMQLTHGDTTHDVYRFRYHMPSQQWEWNQENSEAAKYVITMIKNLHIPDSNVRAKLRNELQAEFSHDHLNGYFETTVWPDGKMYFIDFNRLLPQYIQIPNSLKQDSKNELIQGAPAYPGIVRGVVCKVSHEIVSSVHFPEDAILVCDNTDVRYVPLMKKAGAIVTDRGGILSHASIVARELKKPCIVGTKNATQKLHNGDEIEVNADNGTVRIL